MIMTLALLGFLNFTFSDILDILMVATIIFFVFRWIQGSSAMKIFIAILFLYVVKVIVSAMNMTLMSGIMRTVLDVGVIALIVIFQPEIRYFLTKMGGRTRFGNEGRNLADRILGRGNRSIGSESTDELIEAVKVLSDQKTGALIVIQRQDTLRQVIDTGDKLDAMISRRLLLNLFFKNSPLHDGAVIISSNRVVAARCTLPITGKNIPPKYGMRHKAAVGISEITDAEVVVVSEETGGVSYVNDGKIRPVKNIDQLRDILSGVREGE